MQVNLVQARTLLDFSSLAAMVAVMMMMTMMTTETWRPSWEVLYIQTTLTKLLTAHSHSNESCVSYQLISSPVNQHKISQFFQLNQSSSFAFSDNKAQRDRIHVIKNK